VAWHGRARLFRANALVDRIDRKAKSPLVRLRKRTNEQKYPRRPRGITARLRTLPAHASPQPQPPSLVEQPSLRDRSPRRPTDTAPSGSTPPCTVPTTPSSACVCRSKRKMWASPEHAATPCSPISAAHERKPRELFEYPRRQLFARLTKVCRHIGQDSGQSSHTQRTVLRHGDMVFAVHRSSQPHVAAGLPRQLIPA